jgi:hypothetical protein
VPLPLPALRVRASCIQRWNKVKYRAWSKQLFITGRAKKYTAVLSASFAEHKKQIYFIALSIAI